MVVDVVYVHFTSFHVIAGCGKKQKTEKEGGSEKHQTRKEKAASEDKYA
jgi:hypothetical protein